MADPQLARLSRKKQRPRWTTAFEFTPSMLISVARLDIERRARNVENHKEGGNGVQQHYAFHPGDIRTSKAPVDVLRKAIRRVLGDKTTHTMKNRILLYGDIKLLKQALDLAQTGEAVNAPP